MAAISYDSVAVLKNFSDRQQITYPLLSDPESRIIRAFGILNESAQKGAATYGIPYPGTYMLDRHGNVTAKYFEDDYRERDSASDILVRQFGQTADAGGSVIETKHLRLTTAAGTSTARPGHRIALSLEIDLRPKMHIYSPGVQGYIPIEWKLDEGAFARQYPFDYPPSQQMRLEAIHETVPVYQGDVRITREIAFGPENTLKSLIDSSGELILKGALRYQACDDHECFLSQTVPLEWRFHFEGLERERVPADLQRKTK